MTQPNELIAAFESESENARRIKAISDMSALGFRKLSVGENRRTRRMKKALAEKEERRLRRNREGRR